MRAKIPHLVPLRASFRRRPALIALFSLVLGVYGCSNTAASADAVSLEVARAEHEAGRVVLIDIRESAEHATGVSAMSQLSQRLSEVPDDPARPVLLICNTQSRSSATMRALRDHGFKHVRYVDGGMSEWARRGWPMVRSGTR